MRDFLVQSMETRSQAAPSALRRLLVLAAVACLGAVGLVAQQPQNFDNVEVKSLHVQGNIHMLVGAGGNVTLSVGDNGVLVVDTQFAGMADKILAKIKEIAGDRPIRYIINTHSHSDHIGGNKAIAAAGNPIVAGNFAGQVQSRAAAGGGGNPAFILAHENTLKWIQTPPQGEAPAFDEWPTDVFYGREKDLFFNGEAVVMMHQPNAHTNGDILVHFRESDVVATGDLYVNTGFPFIDRERGGTIQGYLAGLNRLLDIMVPADKQEGGTYAIPGHGRLVDEADVVEYRDMITIIRDRVQDMISRGMTADQVVAGRPARDFEGRYGAAQGLASTEGFIRNVYAGLTTK